MSTPAAQATTITAGLRPRRALPLRRVLSAPVIGSFALLGLVVSGIAIALDGAAGQPLIAADTRRGFADWLGGPLTELAGHPHGNAVLDALLGGTPSWSRFVYLIVIAMGCYVVAVVLAERLPARALAVAVGVLLVVFVLAPPLFSTDVFNYIDYARLQVVHHLDPYVNAPIRAPHDIAYPYAAWHYQPSAYGPLFTLLADAFVPLGLAGSLWAFKALAGLATLGCVLLLRTCAQRLGRDPRSVIAFFALNPLIFLYTVGGAHNDALMELFVIGGIALALARREALGGASVVAASAIKVSAGLVLPFMLAGRLQPRRLLAGALAAGAVILAVAVAAFGGHALGFLKVLSNEQKNFSFHSVPHEVGLPFGIDRGSTALRLGFLGFFAIVAAAMLYLTLRGRDWITCAAWATLALLISTTWFFPWYMAWLLPLAALSEDRKLRLATIAFTAYIVGTRLAGFNG